MKQRMSNKLTRIEQKAGPTGIEPVTTGFLCRWLKSPVLCPY